MSRPASAPASAAASEPAASEPAAGGGELVIWADDKRAAALKPLAEQFGTENGVTVKVQAVSKDLIANFKTASQAGTGPDIVIWAHDVLGDLVANGYVDPIQLSIEGDFDELAIKGMTFDGQLYGVPYNVENIALFRNPELAPDVPATMEDLVAAGKKLVADKKATEIMALQVGQAGDAYHIYPVFSSGGGGLFGTTASGDPDPDNVLVDSPGSIAAGEKIKAMGEKGDKALKTSIDGTNSIPLFFDKDGLPGLRSVGRGRHREGRDPVRDQPDPRVRGWHTSRPFIGVNGFYVASKGKNKAIAQEFATNFATTEAVQLAFYEAEPRPPALSSPPRRPRRRQIPTSASSPTPARADRSCRPSPPWARSGARSASPKRPSSRAATSRRSWKLQPRPSGTASAAG